MHEIYVEVCEPARQSPAPDAGLVDSSPVATLVYDLRLRVIRYVNQALADLAGQPAEALAGMLVDDLLKPADGLLGGEAGQAVPADAFRAGDPVATRGAMLAGEALLHRPDGGARRVEARTTPVDYAGEACGQVALWDITERAEWERQLLHRASHDTLTGLPNAWYASIHLHRALRSGSPCSQHLAVFFVDLDGFKQINDTFGHHVGDAVLRQTAGRLKTMTVQADLTARLHGDEFLMVCKVANAIHAAHLAQRIRRALARPIQVGTQSVSVTASVGIAVSTPASADAERLLRFADHRMYTEKRNSPPTRRREHAAARVAAPTDRPTAACAAAAHAAPA